MELKLINNQEGIDFLAGDEFLQAYFWSEMLERGGEKIERWGVFEAEKLLAVATLIKKVLFGSFFYYYAPRGPRGGKEALNFLFQELKNKQRGEVFIRFEPVSEVGNLKNDLYELEEKKDFRKSLDLQPKKTLCLNLRLSSGDLLKAMHPKTRYNIKLATQKGVEIIIFEREEILKTKEEIFKEFWRLMTLTGERDGFRLHTAAHYKNLLSAAEIKLVFARQNNKNIAAGLFCFFGKRVTYLHGASDSAARQLMAPYLLQWEIIKRAQAENYQEYDFYGIDEEKWPGVTRFKRGFGGFVREYPGTYDFILRPGIYRFYEFLRKVKRLKNKKLK